MNYSLADEHSFVYVAGQYLVVYSLESRQQKFIPLGDGVGVVTAIAISPNRRTLAVAHRAEKAVISIYDLPSFKKRKVRCF